MTSLGQKVVSNVLQRYWRASRSLTMGAQGLILDARNHVVLIRHTYRPGWHFPGGGVEKNETAVAALTREVAEEAGVILDATPRLFSLYANFKAFPCDHIALFVVRDWRQPEIHKPNAEIAEAGLFDPQALPGGTIDPVRRRLDEVLGGAPTDPIW